MHQQQWRNYACPCTTVFLWISFRKEGTHIIAWMSTTTGMMMGKAVVGSAKLNASLGGTKYNEEIKGQCNAIMHYSACPRLRVCIGIYYNRVFLLLPDKKEKRAERHAN